MAEKASRKRPREEAPPSESDGDGLSNGVFDKDTGALSREFETFRPKKKGRQYGKTREMDDHPWLMPMIMLIIAPTGGGKTTLMLNILDEVIKNIDEKKLGKIMLYSGSPQDALLRTLDDESIEMYGPDKTESLIANLRELQLNLLTTGGDKEESRPLNVLVLDDAANNKDLMPTQSKGTEIGNVLTSHRHIPLLIIILSQKYSMIPVFARSNASHVFIFPGHNEKEMGEIFTNMPFGQVQLKKAMSLIAHKPHSFLWIDHVARTGKLGFDKVVLE